MFTTLLMFLCPQIQCLMAVVVLTLSAPPQSHTIKHFMSAEPAAALLLLAHHVQLQLKGCLFSLFLSFSDPHHHHHHQLIDLMMTVMLYEDCPFQLAQSAVCVSVCVSLLLYLFCKWWYSTLCNQFSIISFSNRECWLAG